MSDSYDEELISIGEMARISGFPVSKLRYYHDVGLLKAKKVDELTNYRYYDTEQLYKISFISSWKDLGFSNKEIHEVYESGTIDKVASLYSKRHLDLKYQIEQLKKKSNILEEELSLLKEYKNNHITNNEIEIVDIPEQYCLSVIKKAPLAMTFTSFTEAKRRIFELSKKYNLLTKSLGSFTATFLDFPEKDMFSSSVEYSLPIKKIPKSEYDFIKIIPEKTYVKSRFKGDFSNLYKINDHIDFIKYKIDKIGYRLEGSISSVFRLHSWTIANKDEHITDFFIPVKKVI